MPTLAEAIMRMDNEVKASVRVLDDNNNSDFSCDLESAWRDLWKEVVFGPAGFQPYPHNHAVLIDLLMRGEVLRSVCMTPEDKPDRDRDLWDAAAAKARKLLGVE